MVQSPRCCGIYGSYLENMDSRYVGLYLEKKTHVGKEIPQMVGTILLYITI
jgi:hypothetical protein